jgi:hypothetical protein
MFFWHKEYNLSNKVIVEIMQQETSALPQQEAFFSEKRAIYYGLLFINGPVILLILGIPTVSLFVLAIYKTSPVVILFGFLVGFVLAWLWWSFATPRWRIWAMLRVDNIYLLHRAAVNAQLTWPRDHLFEHTELKSQLQDLQQKHIETRDLLNRFRYYIDYQIAAENSRYEQLLELKRCLASFCIAAYSSNKRKYDAGMLKYLIDQLRLALKETRSFSNDSEWIKLIDSLIHQMDVYQASMKTQILQ